MPRPALSGDEGSRWHCLLTYPQREAAGRIWLERHGIESFYPTRLVHSIRQGVKVEREKLFLPGYLFARFPGEIREHLIIASVERDVPSNFRNVIRTHDGSPAWLHEDSLRLLMAMRQTEDGLMDQERAARRLGRNSRARFVRGAYQGMDVTVMEIKGDRVSFRLKLFGGEVKAEASARDLEKVE